MNIEDNKTKTIFRNEVDGKPLYSIGLSHKKQDGSWESGYMTCRFPKDANIKNKQKIKIASAWIDFYTKDKRTYPYLFINKYVLMEEEPEVPQNTKTTYQEKDIKLTDEDVDKTFNNDEMQLPF